MLGVQVLELDWDLKELLFKFREEFILFIRLAFVILAQVLIKFSIHEIVEHFLLEHLDVQVHVLVH